MDGSLDDCRTFSELGRQIVSAIGRHNLWNDSQELLDYVRRHFLKQFEDTVRESNGSAFRPDDLHDPEMGIAFLSRNGFEKVPCKWYFVEKIEGEWENTAEAESTAIPPPFQHQRVPAGKTCPADGFWFTPAQTDSRRHFRRGDMFPKIQGSHYGDTFWLWAADQTP